MKRVVLLLVFLNVVCFAYLRLTAEPPSVPSAEETAIPPLKLASEVPPPPVPKCLRVGPWKDAATAEALRQWLGASHLPFRERRIESAAPSGFTVTWVASTPNQAAASARRLHAAGVKDFEVLPPQDSAVQTTISFGHFAVRAAAERRVAALRRFGIKAKVDAPSAAPAGGWFEIELDPTQPDLDTATLSRAVPSADGMTIAPCPAEAPAVPPGASPAPESIGAPPDGSPSGRPAPKASSAPA
jgi:hypothetical protein